MPSFERILTALEGLACHAFHACCLSAADDLATACSHLSAPLLSLLRPPAFVDILTPSLLRELWETLLSAAWLLALPSWEPQHLRHVLQDGTKAQQYGSLELTPTKPGFDAEGATPESTPERAGADEAASPGFDPKTPDRLPTKQPPPST